MTILPKKKSVKEKNETENVDHSAHGHNPANEASRASRRVTSSPPPRWNSPTPRDDLLNAHDATALREEYPEYPPHENGTGHKRRHRSPPHSHRTTCRKHSHNNSNSYRGHERGTTQPSHTPSASTHTQHSHRHDTRHASLRSAAASPSTESVYLEELDELNASAGNNSGDEYVPSKQLDDDEEVYICSGRV